MLQRTEHSVDFNKVSPLLDFTKPKTVLNCPTGNFFYDPWVINTDLKGTVWESILESLPYDKGEARVIKLKPGESYMAHADIDDRWHLTLQCEQSYLIDLDSQTMHLLKTDGYWYEMDAGRIHTASNYGSYDRFQLVVRKLLAKNKLISPVTVKLAITELVYDYRYKFDNHISTWLNFANKASIITNFVKHDDFVQFDVEETKVDELIKKLPSCFGVEYL